MCIHQHHQTFSPPIAPGTTSSTHPSLSLSEAPTPVPAPLSAPRVHPKCMDAFFQLVVRRYPHVVLQCADASRLATAEASHLVKAVPPALPSVKFEAPHSHALLVQKVLVVRVGTRFYCCHCWCWRWESWRQCTCQDACSPTRTEPVRHT